MTWRYARRQVINTTLSERLLAELAALADKPPTTLRKAITWSQAQSDSIEPWLSYAREVRKESWRMKAFRITNRMRSNLVAERAALACNLSRLIEAHAWHYLLRSFDQRLAPHDEFNANLRSYRVALAVIDR